MDNNLVSIIIPTYNRANIIGETLNSILAQTYTKWECIVVDDGSTDNTAEVMAGYLAIDDRFSYYDRPINRLKGGNAARNYGYEMAKGDYIQWFDSDDLMVAQSLETKLLKLSSNKNASFCLSAYGFFSENYCFMEPASIVKSTNLLEDLITKRIKVNTLSPLFKKEFLVGKHLFDEKLLTAHELDFYIRIFDNPNLNFIASQQVLSVVRINSSNSILSNIKTSYNADAAYSNFIVRRKIHELSLRINRMDIYNITVKLYLNLILESIKNRDFKAVYKELKYLSENRLNSNFGTKVKYYWLIILSRLLQWTNLKGYEITKKYFK